MNQKLREFFMYGFFTVVNERTWAYVEKTDRFKIGNGIKTRKPQNPKKESCGLCVLVKSLFSHIILIF